MEPIAIDLAADRDANAQEIREFAFGAGTVGVIAGVVVCAALLARGSDRSSPPSATCAAHEAP